MATLRETLSGYDPRGYVPGGSTKKKAQAIQSKAMGAVTPVIRRPNPYIQKAPTAPSFGSLAGGSPLGGSLANILGLQMQEQNARRPTPNIKIAAPQYDTDPVLARIRAMGQQSVANAETEAMALKKKAVIESGMGDVGAGIGLDASTVQAANENPFGTRQQIQKTAADTQRDLNESLNQQNLFYSGYRANQLGELDRNRAQAETEAQASLRDLLGGVEGGLLEARTAQTLREQEEMARIAAEQQAAAQQQAYLDAIAAQQAEYDSQFGGLQTQYNDLLSQLAAQQAAYEQQTAAQQAQLAAAQAAWQNAINAGVSEALAEQIGQSVYDNPQAAGLGPSPYVDYPHQGNIAPTIDPAQVQASIAANPEATFGPSPIVDYSPNQDNFASGALNYQTPAPAPVYQMPAYVPPPYIPPEPEPYWAPEPPPAPAPDPYYYDNLLAQLAAANPVPPGGTGYY